MLGLVWGVIAKGRIDREREREREGFQQKLVQFAVQIRFSDKESIRAPVIAQTHAVTPVLRVALLQITPGAQLIVASSVGNIFAFLQHDKRTVIPAGRAPPEFVTT